MKKVIEFLQKLRSAYSAEQLEVVWILSSENSKIFNLLTSVETFGGRLLCSPHPQGKILSLTRPSHLAFWPRMIRHLRGVMFSKKWQAQVWNLVEKLDGQYEKRCRWHRPLKNNSVASGSVTFFSSYLNNSRILTFFQPLFSSPVHWLVTNYYARLGAAACASRLHWIWQFDGESGRMSGNIQEGTHPETASALTYPQEVLATWARHSTIWKSWSNAQVASLVNLTRCWESYLERIKPRLVVVANQLGIEGWFTQIARSYGIPVLQVMHGVLGGYLHIQTPIRSDALVVPGDFWRNLWPKDQRERIMVYNTGYYGIDRGKCRSSAPRQLTYFSWPLHMESFYNATELMDGFIHLFQKWLSTGRYTVLIRAHPLENPADFLARWRYLYGSIPPSLRISKNEPLSAVLDQTSLSLMYRSTVMLDCLARGIPLIIPDWIHFGWNDALRDVSGIYLAKDFSDLAGRTEEWLEQPPQMTREVVRYFIRPPGEGQAEIRSFLDEMTKGTH